VPVTYRIAADRKTIRTTCTGDVTLQEVIDHLWKLQQDPECPERLASDSYLRRSTTVAGRSFARQRSQA
jgi:hypothetical protein